MHADKKARTVRNLRGYALSLLFVAPALALLVLFVIVPTVYTFRISFFQWDGINPVMTFTGIDNYKTVFADPKFHQSILNNFIWAVMHIVFACGYGFILAYLISRLKRGRMLFRNLLFVPNVIALSVSGVIWGLIYNPQMGLLNKVLEIFHLGGVQQNWLGDPSIALFSVGMASAWQAYGYYMTLFLAGLQNIDTDLYEAAEIDGAGMFRQFIHVTVPGLRHVFTFVLSIAIINGLKGFATVWAMTQGGPGTSTYLLTLYGYVKAFTEQKFGQAMVSGISLGVMIIVITVIFNYIRDKNAD